MNNRELKDDVFRALFAAHAKLGQLGEEGGEVVREGVAFGDLHEDTEIQADIAAGEVIGAIMSEIPNVRQIIVEGQGVVFERGEGHWLVTIDPLDGSLCYKYRLPAQARSSSLPYTGAVQVFRIPLGRPIRFGDIQVAGVMDYRNGTYWSAHRWDAELHSTMEGNRIRTGAWEGLDIGQMIGFAEPYYPQNRDLVNAIFEGKKGWLAAPKSAAYEMALVASGAAAFFLCDRQKSHELAAGMALVLGAGGVAVDFEGNPLVDRIFDFNAQTPVVLAANQAIADELIARIATVRG